MLSLFLLGAPRLEEDGRPVHVPRRKVMAMLAYLAATGHSHTRDALATLLWPKSDQKRAYSSLRRCLSAARKTVGEAYLDITRETVALCANAPLRIDVTEFNIHLSSFRAHCHPSGILCSPCQAQLIEAADLYQGDFLAGFSLPDAPQFDEWQWQQAKALQENALFALAQLVAFHLAQAEPESAIGYARRQLALEPLHEPAQQQLMRLYAATGQRVAALRQYERFSHQLQEELGAAPSAQTVALAEAIQAGEREQGQDASTPRPEPELPATQLRPAPRRRHNLPPPSKPFVGREGALKQLVAWLQTPDYRLVTVTGLGGVGKTRLALRAAAEQVDAFPHGVYFVSLETAVSPADLLDTLAHTLPLTPHGDEPIKNQLFDFLSRQQMLLVLDNFEHLTAATGLLSELLAAAPDVKLLVTSRRRLNLQEEVLLPITGMAIPAEDGREIETYPAVRLFLQQARRLQPDFTLSPRDLPHLIRICRLVDGLPLGLELAASWTPLLSCREIADEIEAKPAGVTIDCDNTPARHQDLEALCDHSWRLLATAEREVMRRLAVFAGSFARTAAQAVAGASLPVLRSLVDHSLLQCGTAACDEEDGRANGRFRLHPVIHQYVTGKLQRYPDEKEKTCKRHCHHYIRFLAQREADLRGSRQRRALAEIEGALANIRAAWRWAIAQRDTAALAAALDALYLFYSIKGLFWQGVADFEQALDNEKTDAGGDLLVAQLLVRQGHLYLRLYRYNEAATRLKRGANLLQSLAPASANDAALALHGLGRVDLHAGEQHAAQQKLQQSLAIFRDLGDQLHAAQVLTDLGSVACQVAEYEEARRLDQEALTLFREIDNPLGVTISLNNLSHLAENDGDYTQAERWLQESLATAQTISSYWLMAVAFDNLSHLARLQDQNRKAARYLQESLALRHRYRLPGVAATQQVLAKIE